MRRILFTVMAAAALCVAVPTAALAHGSHHHKRHHRVRHEFFKAHRHHRGSSSGSSSPTAPTAGTVTSFANNVLTITLTNGNTVSGTVTGDTRLKCESSATQNGDNDADDNGAGDEHGDAVFHHHGDTGSQSGDNDTSQTCTPTPGEAVRSAELTINGNGAVWTEVELVSSSTATTPSSRS